MSKKKSISLLAILKAAGVGYDAEYPWIDYIDGKGRLIAPGAAGDTLIDFLIREIGDSYSPDATRTEQIEAAIETVNKAKQQLEDVTRALVTHLLG